MGLISDPALSKGDVMRELRDLRKRVQRLEAARRLEAATIGAGGLTIKGGALTVYNEVGEAVELSTLAFGVAAAKVSISESTSTLPFSDLATPGPSVTVTIGSSRRCIVLISVSSSANPDASAASCVEVSGASTIPADDLASATAFIGVAAVGSPRMDASATSVILIDAADGLVAGSNTFTLKYSNGKTGGGSAFFRDRKIVVLPY